jgi:hypothetical protein
LPITAFDRVLTIVQETNDIVGDAYAHLGCGLTLARAADRGQAAGRLQAALRLARRAGQRRVEARVLQALEDLGATVGA